MDESSDDVSSHYPQTSASLSSECDHSLSTKHNVTEVSTDDTTFQSTSVSFTVSTVLTIKLSNPIETTPVNPSAPQSENPELESNHSLTSIRSCSSDESTTKVGSETCLTLTSMRGISPAYVKTYNTVNKSYMSSRCSRSACEISESSYDRTYMCLNSPLSGSSSEHTSMTVKPCASLINVDSFSYEITQLTSNMEKEAANLVARTSDSGSLNPYVFFPIVEKKKLEEKQGNWAEGCQEEVRGVEENEQDQDDDSAASWDSEEQDQDSGSSVTVTESYAAESYKQDWHELEPHELEPHELEPHELELCELGSRELLPPELEPRELVSRELGSQEQDTPRGNATYWELAAGEMSMGGFGDTTLTSYHEAGVTPKPEAEQNVPPVDENVYPTPPTSEFNPEVIEKNYETNARTKYLHNIFKNHSAADTTTASQQPTKREHSWNETKNVGQRPWRIQNQNDENTTTSEFESRRKEIKTRKQDVPKTTEEDSKNESKTLRENARLKAQDYSRKLRQALNKARTANKISARGKKNNADFSKEESVSSRKPIEKEKNTKNQTKSKKILNKKLTCSCGGDVRKKKSRKKVKRRTEGLQTKSGNKGSNNDTARRQARATTSKKNTSHSEKDRTTGVKSKINPDHREPLRRTGRESFSKKNPASVRTQKSNVNEKKLPKIKTKPFRKIIPSGSILSTRSCRLKQSGENRFMDWAKPTRKKMSCDRPCLLHRKLSPCGSSARIGRPYLRKHRSDSSLKKRRSHSALGKRRSHSSIRKRGSDSSLGKSRSRSCLRKRGSEHSLGKRRSHSSLRKRRSHSSLRKRGSDHSLRKRRSHSSLPKRGSDHSLGKRRSRSSLRNRRSDTSLRKRRSRSSVRNRRSESNLRQRLSDTSQGKREHLKKFKHNQSVLLPPRQPRASHGRASSNKQPKRIVKPFGRQRGAAAPLHPHQHRNLLPNHKTKAAKAESNKRDLPTKPVWQKTPRFVGLNSGASKKKNKAAASSMHNIAGSKSSGQVGCNSTRKSSRYALGGQHSTQEVSVKSVRKKSPKKTKENPKVINRRPRSTSPSSRQYGTAHTIKEPNSAGPSSSRKPRCKKKPTENPEPQITDKSVNSKFEELDRQGTTQFFQIIEKYTIQTSPPTVSPSLGIDASLGFQTTTVSTRQELRFSNDSPGGSENGILQIGVHSVTESVEFL